MSDPHPALAILQAQADRLAEQFRGVLEPEVSTLRAFGLQSHKLLVIAPKWHGYRQGLLVVRHKDGQPYPATVEGALYPDGADAADNEQLQKMVAESLDYEQTQSLLSDIVAWSHGAKYPIFTTAGS